MSRGKSFSPTEVLERLADVFVTHGYERTSLAQLEAASGLGKQSLYNTFGDKKAMYLGAVECASMRFGAVQALMASAPDGRQALQRFFERLVEDCASDDVRRQTCVVSAGLVEGIDDEEIRLRLRQKWQDTLSVLQATIVRGQADGSIANRSRPQELADHLMAAMGGLRVMARAQPGTARLRRVAARTLDVLDDTA